MQTNSNGYVVTILTNGALLFVSNFHLKHLSYRFIQFSLSDEIPGQKNLSLNKETVLSRPGCPISPWRPESAVFLNTSGSTNWTILSSFLYKSASSHFKFVEAIFRNPVFFCVCCLSTVALTHFSIILSSLCCFLIYFNSV